MARLQKPLVVGLSVAIAVSAFLLNSSMAVQACPLTDGGVGLTQTLRQPNASNGSFTGRSPNDINRPSLDYMGIAGFGIVAGLFAIALLYKIRRSRQIAPTDIELFNRYPQIEHPELALAFIPQEALSSTVDPEFVSAR